MDKEISNLETEEDFNIDKLLGEEEDSPVEQVTEESLSELKKKSRGRPKGVTKKKDAPVVPEVPVEIAQAEKDLLNMEWHPFSQPAYEGYQNTKTGEIIDEKEAIRRTLCYAQEAARNSR